MAVVFPVLRRIEVQEYGIFENGGSSGIRHDFVSGVHVIVGINGLGKTTLLNIMYRLLLGPFDMSKDDAGLASSQHKLSKWRNSRFFSSRVRDDGRSPWAEAEIGFGAKRLVVRRSLKDLRVISLRSGDTSIANPTQQIFEKLVCELSGVSSFFDYFAILRFLVFFLEDRVELIWDRRSQFDMFRILFFDVEAAKLAAAKYDEVQRLDSRYRNDRVPYNVAKDELDALEKASASGTLAEIRAAQRTLSESEALDSDQAAAVDEALRAVDRARLRREQTKLDLEEARRAHEHEQQHFYADLFPDLEETAKNVFLRLGSGGGCAVCGNLSAAASDRLREYAAHHQCPICESLPSQQEGVVSAADFSEARLARYAEQIELLRSEMSIQEQQLRDGEASARSLLESRQSLMEDISEQRSRVDGLLATIDPELQGSLPDGDEDLEFRRRIVKEQGLKLEGLKASRTAAEEAYRKIKDSQAARVSTALAKTKTEFRKIAGQLLAERCHLVDAVDRHKIGQEGEDIDFPALEVMMSSGVFTGRPSARAEATSVSESQREFIDLAFRMALMEASSELENNAMLVLETPEASLDSLFIAEAGALFRSFASRGGTEGNVFIASTNLNNEGMIPALFGAMQPPERQAPSDADTDALTDGQVLKSEGYAHAPAVPPERRSAHIINLLKLSAPNAALRNHREYYERKLLEALYMDGVPPTSEAAVASEPVRTEEEVGGQVAEDPDK